MGDKDKESGRLSVKRRSSRACDQCRKTKGKCERRSADEACSNCILGNLECTTLGPNIKRGPPKGYLRTVEKRLHEVEALLGIFLSLPVPAIHQAIKGAGQDPFARSVLARVESSPFGPSGRPHGARLVDSFQSSSSPAQGMDIYDRESKVNPFVIGPSNAWQHRVFENVISSIDQHYISHEMPFSLLFPEDKGSNYTDPTYDPAEINGSSPRNVSDVEQRPLNEILEVLESPSETSPTQDYYHPNRIREPYYEQAVQAPPILHSGPHTSGSPMQIYNQGFSPSANSHYFTRSHHHLPDPPSINDSGNASDNTPLVSQGTSIEGDKSSGTIYQIQNSSFEGPG